MKRPSFTDEQIIGILGEHEAGANCADLCRKHGMSEGTFSNWKARFGGMTVSEAKRLKMLEVEKDQQTIRGSFARRTARETEEGVGGTDAGSGRDEGAGFKKVVTPAVKREAVAPLKALPGLSERRACRIAGAERKMVRYRSQRAPETQLRGRLRDLANECRRFGYRRLFVLLRRAGKPSGINRIWAQQDLPAL